MDLPRGRRRIPSGDIPLLSALSNAARCGIRAVGFEAWAVRALGMINVVVHHGT